MTATSQDHYSGLRARIQAVIIEYSRKQVSKLSLNSKRFKEANNSNKLWNRTVYAPKALRTLTRINHALTPS